MEEKKSNTLGTLTFITVQQLIARLVDVELGRRRVVVLDETAEGGAPHQALLVEPPQRHVSTKLKGVVVKILVVDFLNRFITNKGLLIRRPRP